MTNFTSNLSPVGARSTNRPTALVAILPNLAGGGAERVTLNLLAGLNRQHFSPHLVLFDRHGPLKLPSDLPVTDLGRPRLRQAIPGLLSALRNLRPDVVFSSLGYVNLALAALRGLYPGRLVLREANLPSLSLADMPWSKATRMAYRLLYPRADLVLATSRRMAVELGMLGTSQDCLAVLPNPVDITALRQRAASPQRVGGAGLRLVAAGRLVRQKGFDRLIPLLSGLPDLHLTILGDGPQRAELLDLAARYEVRLALPGFSADAPAWFAGADAVVLPSRWEGMPNVALEALACGAPVIATPDSGGIAEVAAEAVSGAVTVADMGTNFAAAVKALQLREDIGLRSSLLPAVYDAESVVRQFSGFLEEVL